MRSIQLKGIAVKKGSSHVLENINLSIPAGKFFALLGPSGCGKTTLLRLIAGLENPSSGSIHIGNNDVTSTPVNKRRVNIVFQNYALFPHLTVYDNIAYGLVIEKRSKEEIERKVSKLLVAFDLEKHANKLPHRLSGGQQQRVALARAIVNDPEVLLLDEPLAALDYKLREKMLIELIDLQKTLSTTFVYVTHDQFEALTVADQMAIMNRDGEIEQIGTPEQIYEFPVSSFVANFVGSTNIYRGTIHKDESTTHIDIPHLGQFAMKHPYDRPWLRNGAKTTLTIRPEKILISKSPADNFSNTIQGTVSDIVYHGRSTLYVVQINDHHTMQVFEQNEDHFPKETIDYEDTVYLSWQKENVVLLEK